MWWYIQAFQTGMSEIWVTVSNVMGVLLYKVCWSITRNPSMNKWNMNIYYISLQLYYNILYFCIFVLYYTVIVYCMSMLVLLWWLMISRLIQEHQVILSAVSQLFMAKELPLKMEPKLKPVIMFNILYSVYLFNWIYKFDCT